MSLLQPIKAQESIDRKVSGSEREVSPVQPENTDCISLSRTESGRVREVSLVQLLNANGLREGKMAGNMIVLSQVQSLNTWRPICVNVFGS